LVKEETSVRRAEESVRKPKPRLLVDLVRATDDTSSRF
jgi:hypothetical protein